MNDSQLTINNGGEAGVASAVRFPINKDEYIQTDGDEVPEKKVALQF